MSSASRVHKVGLAAVGGSIRGGLGWIGSEGIRVETSVATGSKGENEVAVVEPWIGQSRKMGARNPGGDFIRPLRGAM